MVPFLVLAALAALPPGGVGFSPQARRPFLQASAQATATVRIVTPARVGDGLGPPQPGMTPRVAIMTIPGGADRTLLVYDFE